MKFISRIFQYLHKAVMSVLRGIGQVNPFAILMRHWFLTLLFIGLLTNIVATKYRHEKIFFTKWLTYLNGGGIMLLLRVEKDENFSWKTPFLRNRFFCSHKRDRSDQPKFELNP